MQKRYNAPAECHPARPFYARGFCRPCYRKGFITGALDYLPDRAPRPSLVPTCHPERTYHAKGLCRSCYNRPFVQRRAAERRKSSEHGRYMRDYMRRRKAGRPWLERAGKLKTTEAVLEAMYLAQEARCATCRSPVEKSGRLTHIDHHHATGVVRGILCHNCNILIGHAKECSTRLRACADYVTSWEQRLNLAPPTVVPVT